MLVMTYNIRGGLGIDGRRSLARVAEVIRRSRVDVACLQEVERKLPRSRFVDQPKWLSERLGMEQVFQQNLGVGPLGFGNLVLTRFPILRTAFYPLSSQGEQRGLLEVGIAAPVGQLAVFCTHWGLDADERVVQAEETAARIKAVQPPALLCGDLNDSENSRSLAVLLSAAELHDLAQEAGTAEPTFPANAPSVRIDYVLGTVSVRGVSAAVLETPASDHRPVVVDVDVSI